MKDIFRESERMMRVFAVLMLRALDTAGLSNSIERKIADLICNSGLSATEAFERLLEVTPMTRGKKRSDMLYFPDYVKWCADCESEYLVDNHKGFMGPLPDWMNDTVLKGWICLVKKGPSGKPLPHPR